MESYDISSSGFYYLYLYDLLLTKMHRYNMDPPFLITLNWVTMFTKY